MKPSRVYQSYTKLLCNRATQHQWTVEAPALSRRHAGSPTFRSWRRILKEAAEKVRAHPGYGLNHLVFRAPGRIGIHGWGFSVDPASRHRRPG
jgi:hypothetical protein